MSALHHLVGVSSPTAVAIIVAALAGSWVLSYLVGGAGTIVPHWYYAPILFTAVRFGLLPAVFVALISGVLGGPLLDLDVATGMPQQTERWLSRLGFFVSGGVIVSLLVRPVLPSVLQALRDSREEQQVREALERGELFLRFQPIVELGGRRLYGFEALIRWQHPILGELGPDRILPAAERSDGIFDLGMFVVREACRAQAGWAKAAEQRGEPPPCVTVNVSARELGSPQLLRRFGAVLAETGVEPKQVCVEITESTLVDDFDLAVSRLAELHKLGVRIAVDDFGTGYSSLAVIHRFPIDIIKLDREFIGGLGKYESTLNFIGGLVLLARVLNLSVVAEGIESQAAAKALTALHVDFGQGFLFDQPLLAEEADQLVAVAEIVDVEAFSQVSLEQVAEDLALLLAVDND